MGMIKNQNLQKNMRLKLQSEKTNGKESPKVKNPDGGALSASGAAQNSGAGKDQEEDNLITYKEFINAIRSLKSLHKTILPRTLSFKEVLLTRKSESQYTVCDTHLDDFGMFRYEMNSIFNKHQFEDEKGSERFMGRNPLSKTEAGKQIKDLEEGRRAEYVDVYRPPGIVKIRDGNFFEELKAAAAQRDQNGLPSMFESTE